MKNSWLIALALPLMAAAPPRQLTLAVPSEALGQPLSAYGTSAAPQRYQPAPLPNRDLSGPTGPRASTEPTLAPTLFTSHERYRGDGFSRGSSVQGEQERNVKPPVGFSLHMPFTPQ